MIIGGKSRALWNDATYDRGGRLFQAILRDVSGYKDPHKLVSVLAKMDAFNSRGLEGRLALVKLLESVIQPRNFRILDVGCGIGGTARHLVTQYQDCNVVGVDITQEYVECGRILNQQCNLDNRIDLMHASALDLPMKDSSFDVVWMEHVQMNVSDKEKLYEEAARVVKPGRLLAYHDIVLSIQSDPLSIAFPCPWANTPSASFLVTELELRKAMEKVGWKVLQRHDTSRETIEFLSRGLERMRQQLVSNHNSIGVHLLMGENAVSKVQNHLTNLREGRVAVVMGIAIKS